MRILIISLSLIFTVLLLACTQPKRRNHKNAIKKESVLSLDTARPQINEPQQTELTDVERRKFIEEENRNDSLRLDSAKNNAFQIARTAFKLDNFTTQYELQPDEYSYIIKIEIEIGKLFGNSQKYFLLRRHVPWATFLNLYEIVNNKTNPLIEREQSGMTYQSDTAFDVNGDGYKDFIVNWYPSSGCCRRNVSNVYLYMPARKNFTKDYEFINPTFSPKEKVIRGVQYGHPGEVGLYKYKWRGLQVDTIEFIYPDVLARGQFIKTTKSSYKPTEKQGIVLNSVPEEYVKIQSYDWFAKF